jgi:hypothetical protein
LASPESAVVGAVFYVQLAEARAVPGLSRLIAEQASKQQKSELIGSREERECNRTPRRIRYLLIRSMKDRSEKVRGS